MNNRVEFTVSPLSIAKVVLVLFSFYLIFLIKDILILFFVVLILSATLRPVVNRFEPKIGRVTAVILLLLIIFGLVAFLAAVVFPPLVTQLGSFINTLPDLINRFHFLSKYSSVVESGVKSLSSNVGSITGGFVNAAASVFGGIFSFITVIVMTIYLLLDKNGVTRFFKSIIPAESQESTMNVIRKMSAKVGDWFRGQMLLCLSIFILDYIGLLIIGVPYALTLAVISGIMEIIPTIGPMISGILAVSIALSLSPLKALLVLAMYVLVQQLENTFLVPKIMQKAVGLSPIVTLLAVLIGAKLLGLIGALLAVPASALIFVIIQNWSTLKNTFASNDRN